MTWAGVVVLVALVVVAVYGGRPQVQPLHGKWSGQLLGPGAAQDVALSVPGLFVHAGVPPDGRVVLERTITLDERPHALWIERAQYAVAVRFDGVELARRGDPDDPAGARDDTTMFVPLPREPGTHHIALDVQGDHGEGGITGRVLLGPTDAILDAAAARESERLGLALILAVIGIIQLGVSTRLPKRPTHLLFGLFTGVFALWAFSHTDLAAEFLDLVPRVRGRRVATGLFPALGLAFITSFVRGRPGRVAYGALAIGGVTAVLGLILPAGLLYSLESAQDVLLVLMLVWVGVVCVRGVMARVPWAAMLLLAAFPPLLLAVVSDLLVSHGVIAGAASVFPAATLFVVGLGAALALTQATWRVTSGSSSEAPTRSSS